MKKTVCIAVCLLALSLLCGCRILERIIMPVKTQNDETVRDTVTFINGVTDADVWILPETEANLKTTVWGTATAAQVRTGESRQVPLCEPGDGGHYILRMIDADGFFYSAGGIALEAGWTMEVKSGGLQSVTLEVTDENGVLTQTVAVFAARL